MTQPIRLLIVGTGGMANSHAEAFADIPGVTLVAGVDPNVAARTKFCAKHGIPHTFDTVQEALDWGI